MQVLGKIPTISINKTDGCHVYLSQDSLSCEIVSAKSSEMNVLVPGKNGDFVSEFMMNKRNIEEIQICKVVVITWFPFFFFQTEIPVPEQFKTIWDGKKLVTTATEIAG